MANKNGLPLERNLFAPVYKAELNEDEQDGLLLCWMTHSAEVVASQRGRGLWPSGAGGVAGQDPDFLFAVKRNGENGEFIALGPRATTSE